jgi:quercetin dioxygenase-like cupin family protein
VATAPARASTIARAAGTRRLAGVRGPHRGLERSSSVTPSMLEVPAGDMSPLHVHRDEDEGFHVVAGQLTVHLPDRAITLRAGEFFLAPRGVPHCYRVGDTPAHVVVLSAPAGFERFVRAVAVRPSLDPAALAALAATASEHGIDLLGPPGTLPEA